MRTEERRPQGAERPTTHGGWRPRMTRTRLWLFWSSLAVYAAIVAAVVTTSWLVHLDWQLMLFRPYKQWPEFHAFLDYFVVLGQRAPTAVAVLAWLGWRAWRQHTLRPLFMLAGSLLLLNVTVGAAKIGMGRLGPHYATEIGSNEMWAGGDIFPSGHTANAVVTWGVVAYLATTPRARRTASVVCAMVALGVGGTTVYLGTHWLSDVLLGWVAGLLVLLALPWFEPVVARAEAWLLHLRDRLRGSPAGSPAPASLSPLATRVSIVSQRPTGAGQTTREMARANSGQGTAARPDTWPHLAPRPHTTRHERSPVTPAGHRRPPQSDRPGGRPQARTGG
ncbi:phosphatase PAP2 family protein [Streptomyces sp. WMMC500]|uniref:phosphatase PAP2 family protein n=1 Tax=Streptomyces sp. WMMC500 TaxID=3015154 RepID=UPI00248B6249|nr:phosphatase PAP2 family protein [Streptomyces sp. WMMC500]WBB60189.1 phosphatase PAP2 family protein [Streptomyces sp. WMMC500]